MRYKKRERPFCNRLGVVACSCNLATRRPGVVDRLRAGVLPSGVLCRSGVRTKLGINMVALGEPCVTRLSKEGRTGPGWKSQQAKVPVSSSSGIAPVNRHRLVARPTQWDPFLFISFLLYLYRLQYFFFAWSSWVFSLKKFQ